MGADDQNKVRLCKLNLYKFYKAISLILNMELIQKHICLNKNKVFFKKFIEDHKITQSMSRVGKCIDNGPMENFWGIIKEEMYRLNVYDTFEELEEDVKRYMNFYNTKRITLSMGLKIPA